MTPEPSSRPLALPAFRFVLLIRGADLRAPENFDALHAGGCGDAIYGRRQGIQFAEFARADTSLDSAVISAIDAVEAAVPGAQVVRVEPDDLVTLTEIANRTSRTKESVRLYSEARRGPGGFPAPVAWLAAKQRIWQWADVVAWFEEQLGERLPTGASAQFLAVLNNALEVRWRSPRLTTADERASIAEFLERDLKFLRAKGKVRRYA